MVMQALFSGREQRRYPRVIPLSSEPVEVHIMGSGFLEVLRARDISVGGIGVEVGHSFTKREMSEGVRLLLVVPGERSFVTRGTIRHLHRRDDGGVFGVEFAALQPDQRRLVERYVERMLALGRAT